ncbi:MAG: hypothetical protein PVH88_25760 [Ignavibacteria bacterium]|jgi:hypothetical protein
MVHRKYINLIVISIIGLGLPLYYKIKFILGGFIQVDQLLNNIWIDVLFSMGLATVTLLGYETIVSIFKKKLSGSFNKNIRIGIQFIITIIYSFAAVYGYSIFCYNVLFSSGIIAPYILDYTVVGVLVPFIAGGIKENITYFAEEESMV